ncbi:probable tubulin polyglutamylase ttll-15 [Amphiura filiformis]|uniref:probable tubulin polyglutamylase ttll-15 n=1 Tax=Amphiura filiformis TaxID=82378 RepID=UPI003B210192
MKMQKEDWIQPVLRIKGPKNWDAAFNNAVKYIFHLLGYKLEINVTVFQDDGTITDRIYKIGVPWTVDHPESPDKVIDTIPGLNEYVTYKASLVTRGGKYIPKGFYLPQDMKSFLKYTAKPENKDKIWIQKDPRFRGNYVRKLRELNLFNVSLVQEFISNPLLVTGRKFSIGVFVAFSSARPLRAYVLDKYMIFRYCGKLYDPADLSDPETYVTDGMERGGGVDIIDSPDDEAELLIRRLFLRKGYHSRRCLEEVVVKKGKDPSSILPQIFDSIRDVLNTSLVHMLKHNVSTDAKYYQYTRWDYVMDENANLHLIEANINPHLNAKKDNPSYVNIFAYIILSRMLRVMRMDTLHEFQDKKPSYLVRDSDVYTYDHICYTSSCSSCQKKICRLCSHCLSAEQRTILKEVLWEHLRRSSMRLVYPVVKEETGEPGSTYYEHQTDDNKLTTDWMRRKCNRDDCWCSVY